MPHEPKPYVERGWYVSRPCGKYLKLCPKEDGKTEANRLLKIKLGELEQEREEMGDRNPFNLTVIELFTLFLQHVELTKDRDTFHYYQRWCTEFAKQHGGKAARSITKSDANDFKLFLLKARYKRGHQGARNYRPKTVNHALIALRRAFYWAIDTEYLPASRNPFSKIKLLPCPGRTRIATTAEYERLLEHCSDDAFRDVLVAMRHSSARPQDIYSLTWAMVNWDDRMWVLEQHKGSRTEKESKPRVIGMGAVVENLLRKRVKSFGQTGYVFLNGDGRPWTKDAPGLRMRRLWKQAGIGPNEHGEEFVLYTSRHTFLTIAGARPDNSQLMFADIADRAGCWRKPSVRRTDKVRSLTGRETVRP